MIIFFPVKSNDHWIFYSLAGFYNFNGQLILYIVNSLNNSENDKLNDDNNKKVKYNEEFWW